MADQLITGTTLVESTTRSTADIPVGGIVEFDDTYSNVPDGFLFCDGSTVNDPLSVYNGKDLPNYNENNSSTSNYLSISPAAFTANNPDNEDVTITGQAFTANADGIDVHIPLWLPHGAIITGVILYGNAGATAETWILEKTDFTGSSTTLATANIGSEDTTITNPEVDNSTYYYNITTSTIDTGDALYGVKITFEPPKFKYIIRIR